jgi:hypothetical protein
MTHPSTDSSSEVSDATYADLANAAPAGPESEAKRRVAAAVLSAAD